MELTPEEKTIQAQAALIHAMEFELTKRGVEGDIAQTAKALAHRIKVEYMEEKEIKSFDDVEKLFHNLELTKVFRESMLGLKKHWDSMIKK
jgi:hypothetical protein